MSIDIFSPKRPPVFGMDISESAVRLVEMKLVRGGLRLEGFAVEPVPEGALIDGKVANAEILNSAIERAMKSLRTRTRHAVLGLPPTAVASKRVNLPSSFRGEELEFAVSSECAKISPHPVDQVNFDYQVLGPSSEGVDHSEVLIGAVQASRIDDLVAMVEAAGIKPYIVDSNALAIQTSIAVMAPPAEYPDANVVHVHFGQQSTSITVFRDGFPIYSKDQAFGSEQFVADLMQQLGCDRAGAAAILRGEAGVSDGHEEVLAQLADVAAQEVARGYQLFSVNSHENAALFVVGGRLATFPGVLDAIGRRTGVPVQVADPFEKFIIGANVDVDVLAVEAPSLLIALGLALRAFDEQPSLMTLVEGGAIKRSAGQGEGQNRPKLNFLPYREARVRENRRQFGVLAGGMAVMALGVGMLVHGAFAGLIAQQEQRNTLIAAENKKLDEEIGEINRLKGEIAALMARRKVIESLQADRGQTVQLMDQLVRLTPPGVYLKSLKQTGADVSVTGYAISSDMVSTFMSAVGQSKYLERPELVEIKAATVGAKRLNEFTLNFSMHRPSLVDEKKAEGKPSPNPSPSASTKG